MSRCNYLKTTIINDKADDETSYKASGKATAIVLAGLMISGAASAQSLSEAMASAYLTNPALTAQRSALEATNELLPQALTGWRPSVDVEAEAGVSRVDNDLGNGGLNTSSIALTLSQNLYQGGETTANIGRAEWLVRAERARLAAIEQDVLTATASAYIDLFTSEAILELAKQNEARLKMQLVATRDRFAVGEVTRTDIAQAEARVAGATASRIEAEGTIRAAEATFRSLTTLEPESLIEPEPLRSLPTDEDVAQRSAEAANPNIHLAEANLKASRDDIRIAKAALLPSLDLEGMLSHVEEPSLTIDRQSTASLALRLRVPLYQGGGNYASVRQNKRIAQQRLADLDAARRDVREGVTSAWQALVTARSTMASIQEQVRAATIALEGTQREAEVGQRTVLDVLDQENDLFQAEVDLVGAKGDEVVASYQLQAAVGRLSATALALEVDPYDDETHYRRTRNRAFGLGG